MSMHVLVCDDDKPTRFVIRRLLTQRLGCQVTECGDGVEALERLGSRDDIDLVILDINMPTLDGVDVVEAIRRTPQLAHLPVIMLSHERREEIVVKLIHLGIFGYVAKPPTAESLLALVDKVRRMKTTESQTADIRLDDQTTALIADGNAEYRQLFVEQAEAYGKVTAVESGLSALAAFKREPSSLVFVGGDLGVVGREVLIRKMREMRPEQPLRIVELRPADEQSTTTPGADEVMPRTTVIADHRVALRRFVRVTGPVDDLCAVTGDLAELLTSASTHVFKTMLDSEVQPAATGLGSIDVCATLNVTVRHQYTVRLDFCQSKHDASQIAASVRSVAASAVSNEDITAALTEILTMIRGRLQAAVTARQVEFECSLPQIRHQDSMEIDVPRDGYGLQLPFTTATGASFTLLAHVTKASAQTAVAGSHAAA
jgi:two-component system, chemotaxis family, chemotaxis protein CheY